MSTITRHSADPTLQQVASIVGLLQKAVKIVCLYPPCNPSCTKAISLFTEELGSFLQSNEQLLLYLAEDGFTFEGESVEPVFGDSHRLSKMCYDAGVSELVFSEEFCAESANETFEIFRRVITKDEGELELGEALWGNQIPGFGCEIIEDQSYLEFNSDLRREFFNNQKEWTQSGHLSDSDSEKDAYESAFDDFDDTQSEDELVKLTPEQSERFNTAVTTLSDDRQGTPTAKVAQEDNTVRPGELLMRVYELDSKETHETALALADDDMFDSDLELLEIIDDLFEQDKRLTEFTDTILTCVKAHSYFIQKGALKQATAILRKLQERRSMVRRSDPDWETRINDAVSGVTSRERLGAVCDILNSDKRVTAADFAEYLATLDWTAYSALTEALGELERKEHRFVLCEFLAGATEEHVDLIASGLYDKRWYVARNTAIILSHFTGMRAQRHMLKAMRNTESRVRVEVVRGCQNCDGSFKSSILLTAIDDEDPQIRELSIETALSQSGEEAFPLFEALLEKLLSGRMTESMGQQIILGYSRAGRELAVAKLAAIGGDWRLIGRSPYQSFRQRAIQALQTNPSDEATNALRGLSRSWCKEIKNLSSEALKARSGKQAEEEEQSR